MQGTLHNIAGNEMQVKPEEIRELLGRRSRMALRDDTLTQAAVLLLLFPKNGMLHVLLTKRTSSVEHHKGQISLPGGVADPDDSDCVATALRETEEEIGLSRSHVEVLGLFDDIRTPTGFRVTPVVAYARRLPVLTPNPEEVEAILEVPLAFFMDKSNEVVKQFERGGQWVDVYFYRYEGSEIWGATAAIIRSFLAALPIVADGR